MSPYQLSAEQVSNFDRDGYLIVRAAEHGLFNPEDLQTWARTVQSWPKGCGKGMPYDEINVNGVRQLMRTENFVGDHDELRSVLCGSAILSVLKQLSRNVRCEMIGNTVDAH